MYLAGLFHLKKKKKTPQGGHRLGTAHQPAPGHTVSFIWAPRNEIQASDPESDGPSSLLSITARDVTRKPCHNLGQENEISCLDLVPGSSSGWGRGATSAPWKSLLSPFPSILECPCLSAVPQPPPPNISKSRLGLLRS